MDDKIVKKNQEILSSKTCGNHFENATKMISFNYTLIAIVIVGTALNISTISSINCEL